MDDAVALSFIIPAYNEEEQLPATLRSVFEYIPPTLDFEVILVDHNSTDSTRDIGREFGVTVLTSDAPTVAALRNQGAAHASGEVLVFLDADVCLTPTWQENSKSVFSALRKKARVLTGSWVGVPENPSWIERYWFAPLLDVRPTHINSGHLIMCRTLFQELGGFDESLETGEDYELSMRAKQNNVEVDNNAALAVIHNGYPKSLTDFFKRELWHGLGDTQSIQTFLRSKVAMLSILVVGLHGALFLQLLIGDNLNFLIGTVIVIVWLCAAASLTKFRRSGFKIVAVNTLIYYVYFIARAISFPVALLRRHKS